MLTSRIIVYKPRSDTSDSPEQVIVKRHEYDLTDYVFWETRHRLSLNEHFDVFVHKEDAGHFIGNKL